MEIIFKKPSKCGITFVFFFPFLIPFKCKILKDKEKMSAEIIWIDDLVRKADIIIS